MTSHLARSDAAPERTPPARPRTHGSSPSTASTQSAFEIATLSLGTAERFEQVLSDAFAAKERSTLGVICFALGSARSDGVRVRVLSDAVTGERVRVERRARPGGGRCSRRATPDTSRAE